MASLAAYIEPTYGVYKYASTVNNKSFGNYISLSRNGAGEYVSTACRDTIINVRSIISTDHAGSK
jgi:hypothetical protein